MSLLVGDEQKIRPSHKEADEIQWDGDGILRIRCVKCGHITKMRKINPTRYEVDRWLRDKRCSKCNTLFLSENPEDLTKYFKKYKPRK